MDLSQLLALIGERKWLLVVAVVVGFAVRQLKPDAALPITVPARLRPLVALLLGLVAGACDALLAGTPWKEALLTGASAAVLAILGHVLGIDVLRGGKELPPLGKAKMRFPLPVLLLVALPILPACFEKQDAKTVLDVTKNACLLANAFLDVEEVRTICKVRDLTDDQLRPLLAAARAGSAKAGASMTCADAGAAK